jgi:hypothetical protein
MCPDCKSTNIAVRVLSSRNSRTMECQCGKKFGALDGDDHFYPEKVWLDRLKMAEGGKYEDKKAKK